MKRVAHQQLLPHCIKRRKNWKQGPWDLRLCRLEKGKVTVLEKIYSQRNVGGSIGISKV